MIKQIIKRDGSIEDFIPSKLNRWGEWGARTLNNRVDWPSVVLETVASLPEKCTSKQLQERLIKTCLDFDTWSYNKMAGRLYAALMHKEVYRDEMPTVKSLHEKLQGLGLMVSLNYSNEEYDKIEKIINHKQDFKYAYYQLHTIISKYSISDRVNKIYYETPQYMYMRMAMSLAEEQPSDRRIVDVIKFYDHLSNNRINAPTPNHINLGTKLRGYASCCLYSVGDDVKSLAIGDHIAYTMTYLSAGIGAHYSIRSQGDSVRNGAIKHLGKLGYFRALVGAVKSNMQSGRGGSCTTYYNIFDPEIETLLRLKNPMSTEDKKIRGMDYSWGGNKFFARKVAKNEDIFLFNCYTAPDLYEALYSNDQNKFEELYQKYEENVLFEKTYINARELVITALNEHIETGRLYEHHIDEMNMHTPFKEPIYSSNLCCEITLPTKPYTSMMDLYSTEDHGNGEVATCSLGGIVVSNIDNDDQYEEVAYYTLLMIDKCIHMSQYNLPHVGVTAKSRLSAGVGIVGLAHLMAKSHKLFTTVEGKKFIHNVAERHYYYLLKASLRLGRELGNAPWIHKTKYTDGWLTLDTYNKNVDEICNFELIYDWEKLRQEIIENKGIRNSVLTAHMPTESSANASGVTNGLYPIRYLTLIKTDNERVNYWAAPEGDSLQKWYQLAWNIPSKDMTDLYAIVQKFTDQAISADFYLKLSGDTTVSSSQLIQDYLYRVKMGLKTKYYLNQETSNQKQNDNEEDFIGDDEGFCESCTL